MAVAIFVSYARLDEDVVKMLVQGLEAARRDVWFDYDLGGGEVWWVKILESIRQADVFVFGLSDNALRSKPCRVELDYARALRRPVLPIKVGPVGSLRTSPLSSLQTIEFRPNDARSAFEVIAALDSAAQDLRPLPDPLPPEPQMPFAYLASMSSQIESGELTAKAQLEAIDELRKAFRDETDDGARQDIVAILNKLKSRPWVSVQAQQEAGAVLEQIAGGRLAPAPRPARLDTRRPDLAKPDDQVVNSPGSGSRTGHLEPVAHQGNRMSIPDDSPTPQARPYWGWSVAGTVLFFVFGLVGLYFSIQVRRRTLTGDISGAARASALARGWGIGSVAVGTISLVIQLLAALLR